MDSKIKFLDDFSLDRRLYWRVGDIYQRYQWEIVFDKGTPGMLWKIRRHGSEDWHALDVKNVFVELSARQVDVSDFERQLAGNIMTQAVFSSSLLEEAKKILGPSVIEEAISNHNEFAEKLLEMIRDLTRSPDSDQANRDQADSDQSSREGSTSVLDATDRSLGESSPGRSHSEVAQQKNTNSISADKERQTPKLDISSAFKKTDTMLRLVKK